MPATAKISETIAKNTALSTSLAQSTICCIDIGNTRTKAAALVKGKITAEATFFTDNQAEPLVQWLKEVGPEKIGFSSTAAANLATVADLSVIADVFELKGSTPTPFKNLYATPETLGADRLAAVAGAHLLFPDQNCLVADCGTCLTLDFISAEGCYYGGSISPGMHMRLQAMHTFTGRLPALSPDFAKSKYRGNSTSACMLAGAQAGMLAEITAQRDKYENEFGKITLLVCGGDTSFFETNLTPPIFAAYELVLFGIYSALLFNA
jgi:type III pantothenate kinase